MNVTCSVCAFSLTLDGRGKADLLRQLGAAGVQLNAMATQLFDDARFTTSSVPSTWRLREISVAELGLAQGGTIAAVLAHAARQGLVPGPLELAPHLRLQTLDQAEGAIGQPVTPHQAPPGSVTVASLPLTDDEDFPCGFYLRRIEGVLWLRGYKSWAGHAWNPADRFVFVDAGLPSQPPA